MKSLPRIGFAALAAVFLLSIARAGDDRPAGDEQLQSWLQHEIDAGRPFLVVPTADSDAARMFAHALLDALWKDPEYHRNLREWVAANPRPVADDQLADWLRHYHKAFADSFEFMDAATPSILWRLVDLNILGDLPRSTCASHSLDDLDTLLVSTRAALLAAQWQPLSQSLAPALSLEFKRENAPRPGDHPVPEFMLLVAKNSLQATADALPAPDGARLIDAFSYGKPASSRQEYCERMWVSSRAIQDTKVDDSKRQVSAVLLRQSVITSSVQQVFYRIDRPVDVTRPNADGFTPGKASVYKPPIAVRNGLAGTMRVHVTVDPAGKPTISVLQSTLTPEKLTALDGTALPASSVMLGVVDAYYRSGTFTAQQRQFDVDFQWK
jgi:hypothetical protein